MKKTYNLDCGDEYEKFLTIIKDYVGSDCNGIQIKDEYIFNSRIKKPLKEQMIDSIIRNEIILNPHTLFSKINSGGRDAVIFIYMYNEVILIDFNASEKKYIVH